MEDLLAERGLDISYESVRRWFLKLGAQIARNLRHTRPIPNGYWHLDEMVIVISLSSPPEPPVCRVGNLALERASRVLLREIAFPVLTP